MARFALFVPLLLGACARASWHEDFDRLRQESDALPIAHDDAPRAPSTDEDLDRVLAGPLDIATLVSIARARNPELREALSRTRAGIEFVGRAGALEDPAFKLETEGVPLRHPGSLGLAQDNKAGFSQSFPFPGNLSLRSESAARDAEGLHQRYLDREGDVVLRVKRAYLDYYAAVRAIEAHDAHLLLMEATEKISDAKFRTGTVTQQDVLKPQLEQVLLHNEVLAMEQMKATSRVALNLLLHRPADAPLGDPKEFLPPADTFDLQDLLARATQSRADLRAAELQVQSTQTALRLAERERDLPDFSVGVDYWQIPGSPDGYGAMLSVNLPWFTGKRSAEARRLEQLLRADEAALEAARSRVQFDVRDALIRVESARRSAALFRNELVPKTAQTVEVSRASYEKDKASFLDLLDAERLLRDVKLKQIQAMTRYESAVADLERAVGADLRRKP